MLVLLAKPTPRACWIGIPLVIVGEAIRIWSAGYITKLSGLVTAGPFAMCRNPLYIGSFIICLGYLAMCQRLDVTIIGIILFFIFHGGAVIHEERMLSERFGEEYEAYCKSVPRFIPRFSRRIGQGSFSFKQVMANDEHRSAIAAVALVSAFCFMAHDSFSILQWLSRLAD